MRRMPRLVVCVVLVLALVGATFAGCAGTMRAAVPAALVGLWKGGSHGNGPWFYEFSPDGNYRTWPERDPRTINAGTVVVDDTTITFSNGGAPVTSTWQLAGGRLVLDGQSYLRA